MYTIHMLTTYCWATRVPGTEGENVFESCEAAVRSLMEHGAARCEITIDYLSETRKSNAKKAAARFVEAYGKDGRRFMPHGVLLGVERPPTEPEKWRTAPRKRVLTCPHCGKPIRE